MAVIFGRCDDEFTSGVYEVNELARVEDTNTIWLSPELIIIGFDVLPSPIQLTALTVTV